MNFSNITNWTIPEGTAKQVTDSLGRVIWELPQPTPDYFYIEDLSGSQNTVKVKKDNNSAPTIQVYYSSDATNWTLLGNPGTSGLTFTLPANSKVYMKCTATNWGSRSYYNMISATGNHAVGGNILSLIYGDNFETQTGYTVANTFGRLFLNDYKLIHAKDLVLPSTTYNKCYYQIFRNCSGLLSAPQLPATILTNGCYQQMFLSCSSLNSIITYANDISATLCLDNWLGSTMATGTFHNLGTATYPSGASGIPSGWTEVNS